ncbi:MAG: GAF domain-containing sensor histidine kinase [Myxococcaceae bacterium]
MGLLALESAPNVPLHDGPFEGLIAHLSSAMDGCPIDCEALERLAEAHAAERLNQGIAAEYMLTEYATLRQSIMRFLGQLHGGSLPLKVVERFEHALDVSVRVAVASYARDRERTLAALELFSEVVLESVGGNELLPRLLRLLLQTSEAADTVALFEREGDLLVMRASAGLAEGQGFTIPVGKHLIGRVAAEGRPIFVHNAAEHPDVGCSVARARGLRALYGVPLKRGQSVVGVALLGSCSTHEFSCGDQILFRNMAARAASLISDVMERRALEEEARRASDFSNRAMSIVGHDLRTPLAAISLGAQALLRRGGLPKHAEDTLRCIKGRTEWMAQLVEDLIDTSRGGMGGGISITRAPADLTGSFQRVFREFEYTHPDRKVRVLHQGDLRGEWDLTRLNQAVGNLVKNALTYSPPDTPVTVTLADDGAQVRVEVHNQGAPIAESLLPHLFEAFQRGENSEHTAKRGLGLGLYIVRQIAVAHDGTVEVQSSAEAGTRFTLVLPRYALAN